MHLVSHVSMLHMFQSTLENRQLSKGKKLHFVPAEASRFLVTPRLDCMTAPELFFFF